MSVVAAAVGPGAAAATYGQQQLCGGGGGGGGARKRKDVVQDPEAEGRAGDNEWHRPLQPSSAAASHGLFVLETVKEEEGDDDGETTEQRSSIGAASDDDEEDGEEADSGGTAATPRRRKDAAAGALACMDALDDALPVKRGLSSFFSGRSRSFANLQDAAAAVSSARDLAKPENSFNKRRRVLRCCSIRRVASTSLTALPPFLPPAGDSSGDGGGSSG